MDSLGEYIYLIVIIIAALSSIFKKKKKTQEREQHLPEAFPDFPELDDVIPEPEVRPVAKPAYVAPKPPPVPKTAFANIPTYENAGNISKLKTGKSVKSSKETVFVEIEAENNFIQDIQFDDLDEAKRAFVYAEIFNRKY